MEEILQHNTGLSPDDVMKLPLIFTTLNQNGSYVNVDPESFKK